MINNPSNKLEKRKRRKKRNNNKKKQQKKKTRLSRVAIISKMMSDKRNKTNQPAGISHSHLSATVKDSRIEFSLQVAATMETSTDEFIKLPSVLLLLILFDG